MSEGAFPSIGASSDRKLRPPGATLLSLRLLAKPAARWAVFPHCGSTQAPRRVDPRTNAEPFLLARRIPGRDAKGLAGLFRCLDFVYLFTRQPQPAALSPFRNWRGARPCRRGRPVDALIAFRDHSPNAQEQGSFAAQSRELPEPYSFPPSQARELTLPGSARPRQRSQLVSRWRCRVVPPSTPGTSLLRMRILAKVPRIITSWFPLRDPTC